MGNNNSRRIPLPSSGFCDLEICFSLQFQLTTATRSAPMLPRSFFPSPSKVAFCPGQHMRWIGWSRNPKGNTSCQDSLYFDKLCFSRSLERFNVSFKLSRNYSVEEDTGVPALRGKLPILIQLLVLRTWRSNHNKWHK